MKIRFSSQNAIGSWVIRLATWSRWSHVEIVLPGGNTLGARVFGGFKVRPPLKKYREVIDIEVPFLVKDLTEVTKPMMGNRYDFLAIIGWAFRRNWQKSGAWNCSEAVASILQKMGVVYLGEAHRVEPRLLFHVLNNIYGKRGAQVQESDEG